MSREHTRTTMTSSESEGHAPSRKRSRTSNSAEDGAKDGKKARGRPRVDTQDATAADRRRTQIRLAQRAYRQRKETTISSLNQKNAQLHSIIDQMNKTFTRFNNAAHKSGLVQLHPSLARELKQATETFTSLAKTANEFETGDEERSEGIEQSTKPTLVAQLQGATSPVQESLDIGMGYSAMLERTDSNPPHIPTQTQPDNYFQENHVDFSHANNSLVPRRQYTDVEIWDRSRNPALSFQPSSTAAKPSDPLPFGFIDMLHRPQDPYTLPNPHVFSVNVPTPDVTPPATRLSTPPLQLPSLTSKSIAPDFTYSYDETTFARRLTRAALEAGFQILSMATIRPSALNYVFRLSLAYYTVEQLRSRFKEMLSRGVNEDLDFEETPFVHLGDAGKHYPRKDANGNIMPRRKNNWTLRQIGPPEKRMVRAENAVDGRAEYLHDIDLSGFEGEWFDAHDVQGYLEEEYGCRLNPKSSFAECLIDDEEQSGYDLEIRRASNESSGPPSLTHSSTNASTESFGNRESTTPPITTYPDPNIPFGLDMSFAVPSFNSIDLSFDQTLGLDLAPEYDYSFPIDNGFVENMSLGLDTMGEVELLPRKKKKKVAWVEVSKIIDELIKHGVCLGRAPGFRRKDVDMALQKALVSPE